MPSRLVLSPATLAITAASLWLAVGCTSDADRAVAHIERAESLLADGRRSEAVLELRSAIATDPKNADANARMATIMLENGSTADALFFYREANRLDLSNTDTAVNLAILLRSEDSRRAARLLEDAARRDPENPMVYVGMAELQLERGNARAALDAARKAVALGPEDPRSHWELGYVHEAMILRRSQNDRAPAAALFETALAAFDRAIELGWEKEWMALLERAKLFGAWPGHAADASEAFRASVEAAEQQGSVGAQRRVLNTTADFARRSKDDELLEWSVRKIVAISPDNNRAWKALAVLRSKEGGVTPSSGDVLSELTRLRPDDADAHVQYARHILSTKGLDPAVSYLEQQAEDGVDPPHLIAAIASFQYQMKRPQAAEQTISRLRRRYPQHPRTAQAIGHRALESGNYQRAAVVLREVVEKSENPESLRLLARSEFRLGNRAAGLEALNRAIELSPIFPAQDHRLRASVLFEADHCAGAKSSLLQLTRKARLNQRERLMLAHCHYETGSPAQGRRLMLTLLAQPNPSVDLIVAFADRERRTQDQRERVRELLQDAFQRAPDDLRVVSHLTHFDMEAEKPDLALARLDREIARRGDQAGLLLLRARVQTGLGSLGLAQADARRAFDLDPRLPGALQLLVSLYASRGQVAEAIASFDEVGAHMKPEGYLLLGQLQLISGDDVKARAAFEAGFAEDTKAPPELKAQLGRLLAEQGEDLERALRLAKEAAAEGGYDPEVADVLGYVYLRSDQADKALEHFKSAVRQTSKKPRPEFHYHLGLALDRLGRSEEAVLSLERALKMDDSFPDAADARRALETARNASRAERAAPEPS